MRPVREAALHINPEMKPRWTNERAWLPKLSLSAGSAARRPRPCTPPPAFDAVAPALMELEHKHALVATLWTLVHDRSLSSPFDWWTFALKMLADELGHARHPSSPPARPRQPPSPSVAMPLRLVGL